MATDNDQLPSEFDVIVIGTGLTESIVSAAASRIGHTVLHLDPRDYYGGKWGTLSWETWTAGEFATTPTKIEQHNFTGNIEWVNDVNGFEQVWYLERYNDDDDEPLQQKIMSLSRRFNIDIFPKVIMAREEMISLLIHSNVSRYLEFKCITKLFSTLPPPNDNIIEPIPLSRSDIFTTKTISLIEKRSLMKFIEAIMKNKNDIPSTSTSSIAAANNDSTIDNEVKFKTFEELSKQCKLSKKVQHLLKSAVRTMDDCYFDVNSSTCCDTDLNMEKDIAKDNKGYLKSPVLLSREFSTHCKQFLESIGRFGNQTPFLWTLYGISETCQAFCRMSAIYGGIFILKRGIEGIRLLQNSESHRVVINSEGKEIKAKHLVLCPELKLPIVNDEGCSPKLHQEVTLARGVVLVTGPRLKTVTQRSVGPSDNEDPTNLSIHRLNDMDVIELDETSSAVPKNYRLLQVTCPYRDSDSGSPRTVIESRLAPFVDFKYTAAVDDMKMETDQLRSQEEGEPSTQSSQTAAAEKPKQQQSSSALKPIAIYGSYFLLTFRDDITNEDANRNILSCAVSSAEITEHVEKAKQIFSKMYPNEEFLPRAPDPQEAAQDDNNEIFPGEEDGLENVEGEHAEEVVDNNIIINENAALHNGFAANVVGAGDNENNMDIEAQQD